MAEAIQIGDIWTTRVFRDASPKLRVFKIAIFLNLSVGVIDKEDEDNPDRVIWYGKGDLQFFDLLGREQKKAANEESNRQETPDKRADERSGTNQAPRRDRRPSNDAGIRKIGNG